MALSELRRDMRIAAITTAAQMIGSMGEEGSGREDHDMTEEEYEIFLEECKKVAQRLENMADKLQG